MFPFAQLPGVLLMQLSFDVLLEDYGIPLAIMGILVVFLALSLLVALISLLPHVVAYATPQVQPEPTPVDELLSDELPAELVAVIAAAVAVTLDRPHRIVRIQGLSAEDTGWSREGRMQHHHSHSIRRGNR
ncbi:MAG: OadG family protein [Planctomycetales bacterium]|nr:OadG family protein [Planctomycetales bacterium]